MKHVQAQELADEIFTPQVSCFFHGSAVNLPKGPTSQPNRRIQNNEVVWDGSAVFATHRPEIALIYTAQKPQQTTTVLASGELEIVLPFTAGVDLIKAHPEAGPVTWNISGGTSMHDALDHIFGPETSSTGYLYCLQPDSFTWEKGLGKSECVSKTRTPQEEESFCETKLEINPRKWVNQLLEAGKLHIEWTPEIFTLRFRP